jgi:hypothetical protein
MPTEVALSADSQNTRAGSVAWVLSALGAVQANVCDDELRFVHKRMEQYS